MFIIGKIQEMAWIVISLLFAYFLVIMIMEITWKPIDDGRTMVEDIECSENRCEITFVANVTQKFRAAGTGSDSPVVGGNDWLVCLDAEESDARPGDIMYTSYVLHFIKSIDNGIVTTQGSNSWISDPVKIPKESIKCVIGLVGR